MIPLPTEGCPLPFLRQCWISVLDLTGRVRITQNRMDAKAIEETMVGLEKVPEELFNPETGGSIPPILPLVIMAGAGAVMLYPHKREKVSFV